MCACAAEMQTIIIIWKRIEIYFKLMKNIGAAYDTFDNYWCGKVAPRRTTPHHAAPVSTPMI